MGLMKDAMIGAWEAGAVPTSMDDVRAWRAAGHTVPLVWVPATNWQGKTIRLPALALETARRLASSLEDEQTRNDLSAAINDCVGYQQAAAGRQPRGPMNPDHDFHLYDE